jgi:hypothetical protein
MTSGNQTGWGIIVDRFDLESRTNLPDFFISYNTADEAWACWIAYLLEEESYTMTLQAWDFRPGTNFVLHMQKAASDCERTIAVLSPAYLSSRFAQSEGAAAFANDPSGDHRSLVPVMVEKCLPPGSSSRSCTLI